MVAVTVIAHHPERGSVFIYLMVACFLFGMLMFAYSRMSGSASQTLNSGQAALAYQEIQEIITQHRRAFERVTVMNGVSIDDIDARYDDSNHVNSNCTTNECQIYKPEGGGITPGSSNAGNMVRRKNAASFAPAGTVSWPDQVNTARLTLVFSYFNQGTNKADVILSMPTNEAFCGYYNEKKAINPDTSSYAATTMGFRYQLFAGSAGLTGSPYWGSGGGAAPHLQGKPEGCAKILDGGNITFWIVAVIYAQ
jgi:ribosomal protein L32